MRYVFLVVSAAVCGLFLLFSSDMAAAQQDVGAADRASTVSRIQSIEQRVLAAEQRLTTLETRASQLVQNIDEYKNWAVWTAGGALTVLGLWFAWRQVVRKDIHAEILQGAQVTINLVNETLTLAKNATESAMSAARERTLDMLNALDDKVSDLFRFASPDNQDAIKKRDKNDELRALFQELTAFEFSNKQLQPQLQLKPNCAFLKAIRYSEENQFDKAIETWRDIIEDRYSGAGDDLKICSRYWIGHEQYKLGRFEEAERTFELAYALAEKAKATDERRLELERLRIEARLAEKGAKGDIELLKAIDDVLDECNSNQSLSEFEIKALHTKGDILYAVFLDAHWNGDMNKATEYTHRARAVWEPLADREETFAQREFAFTCLALQNDPEFQARPNYQANMAKARELLELKVRDESKRLYTDSIGERLKATYAMVQLMVAVAQKDPVRVSDMDTRANTHIGVVHARVWPYSPLRKRPVSRYEFQDDIKWITTNGLPIIP